MPRAGKKLFEECPDADARIPMTLALSKPGEHSFAELVGDSRTRGSVTGGRHQPESNEPTTRFGQHA